MYAARLKMSVGSDAYVEERPDLVRGKRSLGEYGYVIDLQPADRPFDAEGGEFDKSVGGGSGHIGKRKIEVRGHVESQICCINFGSLGVPRFEGPHAGAVVYGPAEIRNPPFEIVGRFGEP